jgi:hypothetical protein
MSNRQNVQSIDEWAREHHLAETETARWRKMAPPDRGALLDLAIMLRLRTGQLVTALELLEETALREGQSIAGILAADSIRRAIRSPGSRPQRAALFLARLRELRYPRLTRLRESLAAEISELHLPAQVKLALPRNLDSDEFRIEITVRSNEQLNEALEALARVREQLARIIARLGGDCEL